MYKVTIASLLGTVFMAIGLFVIVFLETPGLPLVDILRETGRLIAMVITTGVGLLLWVYVVVWFFDKL